MRANQGFVVYDVSTMIGHAHGEHVTARSRHVTHALPDLSTTRATLTVTTATCSHLYQDRVQQPSNSSRG